MSTPAQGDSSDRAPTWEVPGGSRSLLALPVVLSVGATAVVAIEERIAAAVGGGYSRKIIVVPGRLVNVVL